MRFYSGNVLTKSDLLFHLHMSGKKEADFLTVSVSCSQNVKKEKMYSCYLIFRRPTFPDTLEGMLNNNQFMSLHICIFIWGQCCWMGAKRCLMDA